MGAKEAVGVPVAALAKEVQVEVPQLGREGIGVDEGMNLALGIGPVQAIIQRDQGGVALPDEEVRARDARDLQAGASHSHPFRLGQEEPQGAAAFGDMAAKDREGVMMARLQNLLERLGEPDVGWGSGGHDGGSPTRQGRWRDGR